MSQPPSPASTPVRAAQYLRMSTDHQRFSITNQETAIALYAQAKGYEITATYADHGISGLGITKRAGLQRLLADVVAGQAAYSKVLVFDVSRWGRFQDPDQSAHYEFICREAGVEVEYVGEAFSSDGSLLSTLAKTLKRVMAAEYSRELSAKVSAGKDRIARAGYWTGGVVRYGYRRMLLDATGVEVGILQEGDRKILQAQRVIIVRGPDEEVETVRRIFRLYAGGRGDRKIAEQLNRDGVLGLYGRPWSTAMVRNALVDEKYLGVLVLKTFVGTLGGKRRVAPSETWRRVAGAIPALVDPDLFAAAARVRAAKQPSEALMLEDLARLLKIHGRLSATLIQKHAGFSASCFRRHFDGLRPAYVRLGYAQSRNFKFGPFEDMLGELLEANRDRAPRARLSRAQIRVKLRRAGYAGSDAGVDRQALIWRRSAGLPEQTRFDHLDREEMVEGLRDLLAEHGRLSMALIDAAPHVPSAVRFRKVFGSLDAAYVAAGARTAIGGPKLGPFLALLLSRLEAAGGPLSPTRPTYGALFQDLKAAGFSGTFSAVKARVRKLRLAALARAA